MTIFAANNLADGAYTDPADGGVPAALDPRLIVLSARLAPRDHTDLAQLAESEPASIFGYEAMRVMLTAVARATDDGRRQADRAKVLAALFSTRRPFTIDAAGDPAIGRYGVYRLVGGRMSFWETAG
jgi:hypothetical protein